MPEIRFKTYVRLILRKDSKERLIFSPCIPSSNDLQNVDVWINILQKMLRHLNVQVELYDKLDDVQQKSLSNSYKTLILVEDEISDILLHVVQYKDEVQIGLDSLINTHLTYAAHTLTKNLKVASMPIWS